MQNMPESDGLLKPIFIRFLLIYACLALFYLSPWGENRIIQEILLWPAVSLLCVYFYQGYRRLQQSLPNHENYVIEPYPRREWFMLLVLVLVAVVIPPFHSTDLFGYINRGWMQWTYHVNPYVTTVEALPGWRQDPMITAHWIQNPSPYGFYFMQLSQFLCALGNGHKGWTVAWFKLINVIAFIGSAELLWHALSYLKTQSASWVKQCCHPRLGVYLLAWNPLLLLHVLSNGHNDVLLGFWALLATYCILTKRYWAVLPCLIMATLIKYVTLILIPFALIYLVRRKAWTGLWIGLLTAIGLMYACAWPYLGQAGEVPLQAILGNATVSRGSIHSFFFSSYKTLVKTIFPFLQGTQDKVGSAMKAVLMLTFTGMYIRALYGAFQQSQQVVYGFLKQTAGMLFLMVAVFSAKFYPWYVAMFYPLAILLPEDELIFRLVTALGMAQLFSFVFLGQAHFLNYLALSGLPMAYILWKENREKTSLKLKKFNNATTFSTT
jgi:hypothetical protein